MSDYWQTKEGQALLAEYGEPIRDTLMGRKREVAYSVLLTMHEVKAELSRAVDAAPWLVRMAGRFILSLWRV